ncbi:RNA polymerase sigma factor SigM [Phycisphaerae bacterium RAS1]|nr:RNA polymerase sigma factor SigM [Phycisphaerae bacterium RAS1]
MAEGPIDSLSDAELVAGAREKKSGCVDELVRRYWPAIHRFCASYLQDSQLAEDVSQETFAKLTEAANLPDGAFKPWVYKIARNHCLDILRRQQRSPTHDFRIRTGFDAAGSTSGPQTKAAREEREALIAQIIAGMPEEYRSVLQLKYFEGFSRQEMAESLGVSEQAVKGRLVRASDYLQEQMQKLTGHSDA